METFRIYNRKYLGNKFRLLDWIVGVIESRVPEIGTFFDPFCGTGIVSWAFRHRAKKVVANDLLFCNQVIVKAFLCTTRENVSAGRIEALIEELNALPAGNGYFRQNFGGTYFTHSNAGRVDAVRELIETRLVDGTISEQEEAILITSLLYAMDKVANTVGHYDAFLKGLGQESYDADGKHVIDSNVYRPLLLRMPEVDWDGGANEVYGAFAESLVSDVESDVAYLDPPYCTRDYAANYHLLDNVARWEKPELYGKTKKPDRAHLKSAFSKRATAAEALGWYISKVRARHIFLSYNNEGIVPDSVISKALEGRGSVEVFEAPYNVFGNGAGQSRKRKTVERLWYCRTAP